MNRELTGREKVMLLILSVLVMALGYYKLIPVSYTHLTLPTILQV